MSFGAKSVICTHDHRVAACCLNYLTTLAYQYRRTSYWNAYTITTMCAQPQINGRWTRQNSNLLLLAGLLLFIC